MGKQGDRSENPQPHPHPRARRHPENTLSSFSGDLCSGPLCVKTYKHISEHKHVNRCSNTGAHPGINAGNTQELTPTHTSHTHALDPPSRQRRQTPPAQILGPQRKCALVSGPHFLNHRKRDSQHLQSRTPGAGTFMEMSSHSEVLMQPCPPSHLRPSGLTGEWGTGPPDVTGWDLRGVQGHQGSLGMGLSWILKDTSYLGRGLPPAPKSLSGASRSRGWS